MSKKRRSVFTLLLVRIIIVVLLINFGIASIQINETIKLQRRNAELTRAKIQSEISGLLDTWKAILESMDQVFGLLLENTSEKIVNLHEKSDLGNINLHEQLELLGLDTSCFEIKIIEDGTIINTTRRSDLGLNAYELDFEYKRRLLEILENGNFFKEWLITYTISEGLSHQPRFMCSSYQPTKDKKYIVELGACSETADELITMFSDRMTRIKRDNDDVLFVNLHITDYLSFFEDTVIYELHDRMVNRAFNLKENITEQFTQSNRRLLADYIYYELGDKNWIMKRSVFSIITDITDQRIEVYQIIKRQIIIILCFLILLSGILVIATRKLKITLKDLLLKTTVIANGNLKERVIVTGQNEFTTLAEQFNTMVQKLESSQNELKQKNQEIEESNQMLQERNEEITSQKDEISAQRDKIEAQRDMVTKQKDQILEQKQAMTDSIQYASRIQSAILPPDEVIKYLLPKHFILYKPRDIVSGDYYWMTHQRGEIIIVVADCTGHGVPGAFMSMLGSALLNEVVNKSERLKANLILNELRDQVILSLRQSGKAEEAKDGMDISLCILNKETMKLQYAGAYNPLYLIRKGKLKEIKGDKMPIGISSKAGKSFTNNEIRVYKDDSLYMFSDGYADQFGGEKGKKFMSKRFKQLLLDIQDNIMFDQKEILEQTINEWMGITGLYKEVDQIDDIIVMGIKI